MNIFKRFNADGSYSYFLCNGYKKYKSYGYKDELITFYSVISLKRIPTEKEAEFLYDILTDFSGLTLNPSLVEEVQFKKENDNDNER